MTDQITLPPRLDLSAATSLMSTLKDHNEGDLNMDLSEVSHLGSLCLQIMISAAANALEAGRSVSVLNASDRVIDQLRVMGMTPEAISRGRV